jgi:hypothetical protein
MKKALSILTAAMTAALVTGCASGPKKMSSDPRLDYLQEGAVVQLQYNLHPNELTKTVSAMNYQPSALLTRCTPVTIVSFNKAQVVFALESGVQYRWVFDKHLRSDKAKHFSEFFVPQCDKLDGLSEIDQQGIVDGQAFEGMTRKGVLYALGLPPDHATPNLEQSQWTYWKNKFARMIVTFDSDGKVTQVK